MTSGDPELTLRRLHAEAERISSNLVELEIDSSRQMLDASALTGQSAASWSAASDALTELWRRNGLLDALLARADKLRGFRRADQLRLLLDGESIELASASVPLSQRRLTGSSQVAQRCTADELITGMSASFDQVKEVVARVGDSWQTLIPKIDAGRRLLQESRALGERAPGSDHRQLDAMSTKLEALGASVTSDPLSVLVRDVDDLVQAITAARDELDASVAFHRGFEAKILAARELLEQVRATQQDAAAAHAELVLKIASPTAPLPPVADEGLEVELTHIADLAERGAWGEARQSMNRWTTRADSLLEEARKAADTSRAPIDSRNQFRALLEAYRVKSRRLGRLEDPELAAIFARAKEVLYTAPTDLAAAAQLVRSYQQALNGAETRRSEMR